MRLLLLAAAMVAVTSTTSAWAGPIDLMCSGQKAEWAPEKQVLYSDSWSGVLDLDQRTFGTPIGVIQVSSYDQFTVHFAPNGPVRLGQWRGLLDRATGEWVYLRSSEDPTVEGPAEGYEYICKTIPRAR